MNYSSEISVLKADMERTVKVVLFLNALVGPLAIKKQFKNFKRITELDERRIIYATFVGKMNVYHIQIVDVKPVGIRE